MTVSQLRVAMPSSELTEWFAFDYLESLRRAEEEKQAAAARAATQVETVEAEA